jgi:hypothetical protein
MVTKKSAAKTKKAANKPLGAENPHKAFRLTRRRDIKKPAVKLPGVLQIMRDTAVLIKNNFMLFGGLTLIYLVLAWLINGLPSQDEYLGLKAIIEDAPVVTGAGTVILGAFAGAFTDSDSDVQQFILSALTLVFILCFIWAARKRMADSAVSIREVLYNAPAPLISFLLVAGMVALHLLPGIFGTIILSFAFGLEGGSRSGVEAMLFTVAGLLAILISTYLVLHSVIALVIVTLPNMYPLESLRSAKKLVYGRRFQVLVRFFGLAVMTLLIWTVGLLPFVLLDFSLNIEALPIVPYFASILAAITIPISTVYLYRLYRTLL